MEPKEFQAAALDRFMSWIDNLGSDPLSAWQTLNGAGEVPHSDKKSSILYATRSDGAGRSIPHVCLKIPTGGGKTYLAASILSKLNITKGLALWIVPTDAIFVQTWASLTNRSHPYRRMLERATGGRIKVMRKDDPIQRLDVENSLCIMVIMLQAVNRKRNRNFLKMYRPSGAYGSFFPDVDDKLRTTTMLDRYKDLQMNDDSILHSLLNVFKICRPVVILDEAHKAYGNNPDNYVSMISQFDPRLLVEMSATPNRLASNILVDVSGRDLHREEMIKMPVNVEMASTMGWRNVLRRAKETQDTLENRAAVLKRKTGRYIRPVAVVRVERTGHDQMGGNWIHSEDVRECLVKDLGVPSGHIAIKSSTQNDLKGVDLMSEDCQICWIITKDALKEGWDCPFAYSLVILDRLKSERGIIQLLGRILRQPHTKRTGDPMLDQCYVFCNDSNTAQVTGYVRAGLAGEGMGEFADDVITPPTYLKTKTIGRRAQFQNKKISLPKVLHRKGKKWEELDYEKHILSEIDWSNIQSPNIKTYMDEENKIIRKIVDLDREESEPQEFVDRNIRKTVALSTFLNSVDLIPNRWHGARIIQNMMASIQKRFITNESVFDWRGAISMKLESHVRGKIDEAAEKIFRNKINNGTIRFDLTIKYGNYNMDKKYHVNVDSKEFRRKSTHKIKKSLFDFVADNDLNDLEKEFAGYMDEEDSLRWWHRIVARGDEYYLKGWKRDKIWPDFLAMREYREDASNESHKKSLLMIFDTKGDHLKDNPDTQYKEKVFDILRNAFNCGTVTIKGGSIRGTFKLVYKNTFAEAMVEPAPCE